MRSGRSGSSLIATMPAMGARDHAVVDRELVAQVAALGHLDRVDVPDQVPDGGVGRGELLRVAVLARDPARPRPVALVGHELAASGADGVDTG